MSLTVEQILNECRENESIQTFELEKQAAAHTTSSSLNDEDVSAMVELLKTASVPETEVELPQVKPNIYEKVAEAAILNSIIQTIDEEGVKLAEFRELAILKGHDSSEVDAFLSKKASASALGGLFKSKAAKTAIKGLAAGGALTAAGGAGYHTGKEKQKETTKIVGRAAFGAGRKYQYSRDRALAEKKRRLREYLQKVYSKKNAQ